MHIYACIHTILIFIHIHNPFLKGRTFKGKVFTYNFYTIFTSYNPATFWVNGHCDFYINDTFEIGQYSI